MAGYRLDLEVVTDDDQLAVLEHLVCEDPDGSAEFGGFYRSAVSRLGPFLGPARHTWLLRVDGLAVGFVDADNDRGRVDLAYFVVTSHRGLGIATQAVCRIVTSEVWPEATLYAATIRSENAASAGVVRAVGFRAVAETTDREVVWEYRIHRAAPPGRRL